MKKFPLIYFISLIFTVYCFSSCINITESDSDSQFVSGENIYSQNQKTITLTGKIGMDGAVPEELMPFCSVQNSNRAAVPSISVEDGCEYFIEAVCGSETPVEGNVNVADGTYSINLVLGKKYTITAGIRKSGNVALSDSWLLDELTREKAVAGITHDFVLTTAKGVGDITLKITVPATVKSVTAECSESGWTNISLEEDSETANLWILRTTSSITSGQYEVTLYFRNESNILLYATTQAINVFKGLETKIWRDSGSTDQLISDGNFALTQAIIESYARTQIYVGSTEVGNVALDATGNDLGAGTPYSPFAYLDSAFALIENANSTQNAYTIWVTGTISKTSTLNTTKAKSVSIVGTTLMNNGVPQDSLDGGENGTVLTINTSILVKIRKLKITNGNASALNDNCGGGLYIDGGANVILENGALVGDENKIPSSTTDVTAANKAINGGGIYIKNGLLTMKKGSKVRGNYAGSSSDTEYTNGGGGIACVKGSVILENGSEISYNAAFARGGGILLNKTTDDVTLKIKGGSVSHNEVYSWGGGVYVGSATFNMQGGEISYNKTVGTGDVDGRSFGGGGICCASGTTIISGGEISENTAAHLTKGSGAVKIEAQNSFTIQDSAKIPYGVTSTDGTVSKGIGKNDIGVRGYENSQGNYIYIKTVLTEIENFTIGITLTEEWKRGLRIANGYIQINNYLPYFEFTNTASDWTGELAGNYNIQTNAPIYVAGATTHPVCNVAGSDESTADGSKTAPFATIEKACEGMNNTGINYIIKIDGEVTGAQEIPDTLTKTTSGTYKAKSLTLCGASGLDSNNKPQDTLHLTSTGSVLSISTNVPVTIKDLNIFGSDSSSTPTTGLTLATGKSTDVTISAGVVISNHYNSGVTIGSQGTLTMTGGDITTNHAEKGAGVMNDGTFIMSGGCIERNMTTKGGNGAGVYISGFGKLKMSGGYIIGNTAGYQTADNGGGVNGGGVYFSGTFEFKGGEIYGNYATNCGGGLYADGGTLFMSGTAVLGNQNAYTPPTTSFGGINRADNGSGGAIYSKGASKLYIGYTNNNGTPVVSDFSGCIKGNYAKVDGGGIYTTNEIAEFKISGGTISYNAADGNGGAIYAGGKLSLLNKAYIPVGTGNKNDVYLDTGKTISIPGSLTKHDSNDTIKLTLRTPNGYASSNASSIAVIGPSDMISSEYNKFTVLNSGWAIISSGKLFPSVYTFAELKTKINALSSGQTLEIGAAKTLVINEDFSVPAGISVTIIRVNTGSLLELDNNVKIGQAGCGTLILDGANMETNVPLAKSNGSSSYYNVTFKNAKSNSNGGAITTNTLCNLLLDACTFENCSANNGGAIFLKGDALDGDPTVRTINTPGIKNCTFKKCTAKVYGGAIYHPHYGGTERSHVISISDCTFEECSVRIPSDGNCVCVYGDQRGGRLVWNGSSRNMARDEYYTKP